MLVLNIVLIYLTCGVLFAVPFLLKWIEDVDEAATGTSWRFKVLLLPGTVVFWPVLLKKFLKAK